MVDYRYYCQSCKTWMFQSLDWPQTWPQISPGTEYECDYCGATYKISLNKVEPDD